MLITESFDPKISDFGFSRESDSEQNITETVVGPLKWMAPECFQRQYSQKSDVWAFGVTVVEILTQNIPFPDMEGT